MSDQLVRKLNDVKWDFQDSKSDLINSIHSYPAKFISDIPKTLLDILPLPNDTVVLDPFCGSGVTLLEAQKRGFDSIGVDLNPIACLLSRVKSYVLPDTFELEGSLILKNAPEQIGVIIPNIPNLDHWFKIEIQEAIVSLINQIDKVQSEKLKECFRFCLSSIIVKVSNQDSDTRYAAIDKNIGREDVYRLFNLALKKLLKAKQDFTNTTNVDVLNKNILTITPSDFPKKVGLVITSPPYPNAYEYWLYHKYRMFWLGFDPIQVKNDEIGARAHYFKKNHQTEDDFIVQMNTLFLKLSEITAEHAYLCFVIGNSKIHGRIIENDKIIQKAGSDNGFKHVETITRTIKAGRKSFNPSHARIKEEYIVIMQKQ